MDYRIGGYRAINAYVEAKLRRFGGMERNFESLFELMFSESGNVMYERSEGYRIKKLTYGEVKDLSLRLASSLSKKLSGLPADSVVGLYMSNSAEWIECFWAIIAAGFRPLLLNMRLSDALLADGMRSAGCAAVIAEGRTFEGMKCLSPDTLDPESDPVSGIPFGSEILVMSSGTTLSVKVCAYTAEEFYYQIYDSYGIIKKCTISKKHYEGSLKLLTFLPFYHVFGLIAVYIWFSFFSRTFVHLADMAPQTIVNTVKRHGVTHIFAVPLFWEKVYEQAMKTIRARGESTLRRFERAMAIYDRLPDRAAALFSRAVFREVRENLFGESVCFMITGGSPIPAEVLRFFNGIGYRLCNGYGMTEIGITSFEISSKKKYLNGGFVGCPMTHAEYGINDRGELLVRGEVIAKYVVERGVRTDRGEMFNTHDLAECVNGHYRILGRRDDLIVGAGGENINPNAVEPLICAPGTDGSCLIGVPGEGGKVPVLLVSVGRFITSEKLAAADSSVRELIAKAGLSRDIGRIVFIAEPLMRADEFKLNRARLANDYINGRLNVVDPSRAPHEDDGTDGLTEEVRSVFAAALGKDPEDIASDADFFLDEGGMSLDYFAMMAKLQEEFGVPFPQNGGIGLSTVRRIADYIRKDRDG